MIIKPKVALKVGGSQRPQDHTVLVLVAFQIAEPFQQLLTLILTLTLSCPHTHVCPMGN